MARTLRVVPAISEIAPDLWDPCANPDAATHDPFVSHAFLAALEAAGTTGEGTGWIPQHLVAEGDGGTVAGVMPLYLKTHSQGEFVFDHSWADAFRRAGGRYYPKLQCAVPFTPVPGRRLLVRPGEGADATARLLARGAIEIARRAGLRHFAAA